MNPMSIVAYSLVALGGAIGSMCRFGVAHAMNSLATSIAPTTRFPFGTWTCNILGCLFIGMLAGLAIRYTWMTPEARFFLFTGLMGGFTTFSTFSLESVNLILQRQWPLAFTYVGSSVVVGFLATCLGLWLISGNSAWTVAH